MRCLPCARATEARRLLRVLFLRLSALSAYSSRQHRLLFGSASDRTDARTAVRHMTTAAPSLRARAQLTDVAGTFGAVVAAMCCAGTPFIIAAVAAVGLSALRKDAILWPVMLGSLVVAIWGYWRGYRIHRAWTPLVVGSVGAVSLAVGVIVVHGFPAMPMIYGGAILLIAASVWNIVVRKRCPAEASS